MKITDLAGKKVCILGFGREGRALFNAIEQYAPDAHVTVADENQESMNELIEKLDNSVPFKFTKGFNMQSGDSWLKNLDQFDVIIKSPGIPPSSIPQYDTHNTKYTSSTQIFLDTIAGRGAITIGVTGTKGKSTTASLIYSILKEAKKDALLLGNIGEPAIAHIDDVKKGTIVVMEMSSYQLMNLTTSPHIAVVTSFFPDHLNYHASSTLSTGSALENYMDAKKNITRHQTSEDIVFFNKENEGAVAIANESMGERIPFSRENAPVDIHDTRLLGTHNLSNIAAAVAVSNHLHIPEDVAIHAIQQFTGLPHRLENIGTHAGITWIDDAISTTPESTIAAIDALEDSVTTIILGGLDRGYDFSSLAERIKQSSIKTIILFSGSGPAIKQALDSLDPSVPIKEVSSMKEAVQEAHQSTNKAINPVVLLSTASPSYGMFKNFEDKGNQFKEAVLALGS